MNLIKCIAIKSSFILHRQGGAPMTHMQSPLGTAPDFTVVLLGSHSNSYTSSTQTDVCLCTHIVHNTETTIGQNK